MQPGQFMQRSGSLPSEADPHEAPVARALFLANEPSPRSALHETHHGIVPLLEEFGQFGDGGPRAPGVACHAQQQLVLLGG